MADEISAARDEAPRSDGKAIQRLLQGGLGISVALMLSGLLLQLTATTHRSIAVKMFEVFAPHLALGERLMALGVLALAFTPVLRVVMLIALWAKERDWRFVGVAIAVVLVLAAAIATGGG